MGARTVAGSAPAMPLPSRSQTQEYRGVKSMYSTNPKDLAAGILKTNGIMQSLSQSYKTSTGLNNCTKQILQLNTLSSQSIPNKKPHSSLKNGHPSRTGREAFKFNQQDSGRLSRASSATPVCSAVIVKMDRAEIHKAERETKEQSGPSLHSFGHHHSSGKSPNPKTVHFDSDLEDVCYFSKTDKPLAISTSTSHIGSNLFSDKQKVNQQIGSSLRWEIFTPNFPDDTSIRKSIPVRVQRLYFSRRYMTLFVFIVVANLAFEKSVTCRFTQDYWKTSSEIPGQYYSTPSSKGGRNCDTFVVGIRLTDVDGLDLSPLFLCVRYIVNDQELWDNNSGVNFEVDFKKIIN